MLLLLVLERRDGVNDVFDLLGRGQRLPILVDRGLFFAVLFIVWVEVALRIITILLVRVEELLVLAISLELIVLRLAVEHSTDVHLDVWILCLDLVQHILHVIHNPLDVEHVLLRLTTELGLSSAVVHLLLHPHHSSKVTEVGKPVQKVQVRSSKVLEVRLVPVELALIGLSIWSALTSALSLTSRMVVVPALVVVIEVMVLSSSLSVGLLVELLLLPWRISSPMVHPGLPMLRN